MLHVFRLFLLLIAAFRIVDGASLLTPDLDLSTDEDAFRHKVFADLKESSLRKAAAIDRGKSAAGWKRELSRLVGRGAEIRAETQAIARQRHQEEILRNQTTNVTEREEIWQRMQVLRRNMTKLNGESESVLARQQLLDARIREANRFRRKVTEETHRRRAKEAKEERVNEERRIKDGRQREREQAHEEYLTRIAEAEGSQKELEDQVVNQRRIARERAMEEAEEKAQRIFTAHTAAEQRLENDAQRRARVWAARRVKEEAERKKALLEQERQSTMHLSERELQEKKEAEQRTKAIFFSMMGDMAMTDMMDMLTGLRNAANDANFMSNVSKAAFEFQVLSAQYVKASKEKVQKFREEVVGVPNEDFLAHLAYFLYNATQLLSKHQEDARRMCERVHTAMPFKLKKTVGPMLASLAPTADVVKVNAKRLATTHLDEACDQVSRVMANISQYEDLSSLRDAINATGKMVPMLSILMPDLTPEVTELVQTTTNVAYIEATVFEEATRNIVTNIGPLITQRLKCTWSSTAFGGVRLRSFSAALVVAGSWLVF